MRGIQISLTAKERKRLIDAVYHYIDMMDDEGAYTRTSVDYELNDGLGSALCKLCGSSQNKQNRKK